MMKKRVAILFLSALLFLMVKPTPCISNDDHKTLEIGARAPDFKLPGTDGKIYSLASFRNVPILVIIFTCNHCPTAQAYEDRIIQLVTEYKGKGVSVVAVMPNDPKSIRLDELGYTDMSDSFEEMKLRAKQKKFNFPYLFDGNAESMSKAYGPVATPHVFIFDKERKLRYQGRIDDLEKPGGSPSNKDTRNAIEALLYNKEVPVKTTKVFGCSIKWTEKSDWIHKAKEEWAHEKVNVEMIDETGVKDLLKKNTDKLQLINLWATWCGPCVTEFPEFITMNRMYRRRDFEFISISLDDPSKNQKVLKFLVDNQASNNNYLFNKPEKYELIETIDPNWKGALPYTILVEPGGKIVYAKEGIISPFELKKKIVDNHLIGRYY